MATYDFTIFLKKRTDDSIAVEWCSNIPTTGLPAGDTVNLTVVPGDAALSQQTILTLCVFDRATGIQGSQKGGLVALWGLFQDTRGLFLSNGLVPINVGRTNSPSQVTFTNINTASSEKISFFSATGTVQLEGDRVKSWALDPELVLRGGGM